MYRAIIVDDELLIRVAYQSIVDWEECGFELSGTFENGRAALEAFDELLPDLVLTDTRMPLCDGIELIRQIKRRSPDTICVILSAYGDLDYVKEGMRVGAEDYLLKLDITQERLEELLRAVKQKLKNLRKSGDEAMSTERQKERDEFLRRWVKGAFSEESTILDYLKFHRIKLESKRMLCMSISFREEGGRELSEDSAAIARQTVLQALQSSGTWLTIDTRPNLLCAIGDGRGDSEQYVENTRKSILLALKSVINLSDVTVQWKIVTNLLEVPAFFKEKEQHEENRSRAIAEMRGEWMPTVSVVERASGYIRQHYCEELSLGDIAGYCGVTPSYLSRIFSRERGVDVQEYLTDLRIEKAKELLGDTNQRVYEIAMQSGYSDAVYFNKVFKKNTGMTPKEYRVQEIARKTKNDKKK